MTTTTPARTIAETHRIAADLVGRPDLDAYGAYIHANSIGLTLQGGTAAASLRAAYALFDGPSVRLTENGSESSPHAVIVSVDGHYRDIPVSAQHRFTDAADLYLIRALDTNGQLLVALTGDTKVGA